MTDYPLSIRSKAELLSDFAGVTPPAEKMLNLVNSLTTGAPAGATIAAAGTLNYSDSVGGGLIPINLAADGNITLGAGWPIGTLLSFVSIGEGLPTFLASGGTVNASGNAVKIAAQWGVASVWKRTATDWVLFGNVSV